MIREEKGHCMAADISSQASQDLTMSKSDKTAKTEAALSITVMKVAYYMVLWLLHSFGFNRLALGFQ